MLGQRKLHYSLNFILPCPIYSVYFYNTSQLYLVLLCKFELTCRFLTLCVYSLLQQKWKSYGIPLCMYLFAFNLEQKYKSSNLNKFLRVSKFCFVRSLQCLSVFMQFDLADYKDILVALWIPSWYHSSCLQLPLWTKWEKPSQSCWNVHVHPNPGMAAPHYILSTIAFILVLKVSYQYKIINDSTFMLIIVWGLSNIIFNPHTLNFHP